jgi:dihydrofolate synthase/folylpolyglutamate synthase
MSIKNKQLLQALAELDQLTNWESRARGEMRVGLEPILDLADRLGNPHQAFRSIHVAGTKGKSSTCALLEAGLRHAGISVGRYSSPHVEHISERISINGTPVSEAALGAALTQCLTAMRAARSEGTAAEAATWFDLLTAAGFLVFRDAGVEWAVVETGLGGRLDSTNIVASDIAVITNIGLEHTEILGDTRRAIAFEKAGIIKPDSIVVTLLDATDEAGEVIDARARELGSRVLRPDVSALQTIADRNTALAGLTLDALGQLQPAPSKSVGAWLLDGDARQAAQLPGRLELFHVPTAQGDVAVVLDGAHVPFNLEAVLSDLARLDGFAVPGIAVVAIAADKDAAGLLQAFSRYPISLIFTSVSDRFRSPEELHALAAGLGITSRIVADPQAAYAQAVAEAAGSNAWVLVTGSLYLVGALRETVVAAAGG